MHEYFSTRPMLRAHDFHCMECESISMFIVVSVATIFSSAFSLFIRCTGKIAWFLWY